VRPVTSRLPPLPRPPAWAAGVFALALGARLAFLFGVDQPLLYGDQYTYLRSALRLAAAPDTLDQILRHEDWRVWIELWLVAPLYFLMATGVLRLFGPHLLPLQLVQCALDAGVAVMVADLGRRVAGRRGALAGVAYACYWPAIEMSTRTLTENAHNVLLVGGILLLVHEAERPSAWRRFAGGFLLGLSALARAVSTGLVGLVSLARFWPDRWRRGLLTGGLVALGAAAAILPWTARNAFLVGDPMLIEDTAFENIWYSNHFVDRRTYHEQDQKLRRTATNDEKRRMALGFAIEGVRRQPSALLDKARANFWHFLRPEGLHNLLRIERSQEAWRHAASLLLDDALLLPTIVLLPVCLLAGPPSRARTLIGLWIGYYLFMIVVVFHNEIRYRSAIAHLALAAAAGGLAVLADRQRRFRPRTLAALGAGLLVAWVVAAPFAGPAWRAARAGLAQGGLGELVAASRLDDARRLTEAAGALDPKSPRPWQRLGSALAWARQPQAALDAYAEAAKRATIADWSPRIVLPRLLSETGDEREAARALHRLHKLSWDHDSWLVLEVAWRELPPPRAFAVELGQDDYGAVRGFFHPRGIAPSIWLHHKAWNRHDLPGPNADDVAPEGTHRWSRGRAWVRLLPPVAGSVWDVGITMGSPYPSPLERTTVKVSVNGGPVERFEVGREVREHPLRAAVTPGEPIVVRIEAPTWCLAGEPAETGVRVDRVVVRPPAS
jgi:4-amino-4-deoxy-L-arabinose transferase-like glycosyltransferase